ncbi:MAG: cytosine-specific methylase [Frankiales bacterium]|nr:cytosine-specific methylase [Frankiales bacterium]
MQVFRVSANVSMTDLFCGAGGSSSGATGVPGVRVRMAANHWALAIETHNRNHPETDHDCADLSQVDPRRYPHTDILWASPECTNHSQAKGRKRNIDSTPDLFGETLPDEAADRSRATMWDVPRFAEHHHYRAVIVENVVDAAKWVMWPAWIQAMQCLGYEHQVVYLNSMHAQAAGAPAPQSRDRMYVVFWRKGDRKPNLAKWTRPLAWCPTCDEVVSAVQSWKRPEASWGRYRSQYVFRCPNAKCRNSIVEPAFLPAAAAIDWTLPGDRIGDRARPLADKTRARIAAGLAKYARPITLEAAGNTFERRPGVRTWPIDGPLTTLHTTASKAFAYEPMVVPLRTHGVAEPTSAPLKTFVAGNIGQALLVPVEGRDGKSALPASDPFRTQTARNETGVLVPPMLVPAGGTWNESATSVDDVMRTRTTRDSEAVVVPPFIAELRGGGSDHRSVDEPLCTVTAAGNHHALVQPGGAMVMRNNTARGNPAQMCTPTDEELRTLTTTGHQSLIQWAALYGYDSGNLRSLADVLPTQTTVEGDALLSGSIPDVDDCYFRMLEPHEIQAGMAFARDYLILGNKREQVRQLGNAVTPPAARDLIAAVVEALTGEQVAS